jgi:hypothetical protein
MRRLPRRTPPCRPLPRILEAPALPVTNSRLRLQPPAVPPLCGPADEPSSPGVHPETFQRVLGMTLLAKLDFPDMAFTLLFVGYCSPDEVGEGGLSPPAHTTCVRA